MSKKNHDDFDQQFNRVQKFALAWFVFVGLLAIVTLCGLGFVVFKLLVFFGVL